MASTAETSQAASITEAQPSINEKHEAESVSANDNESRTESVQEKRTDNKRDDAIPVAEIGESKPGGGGDKDGGRRKRLPLEEITRFTMVKRIW